MIHNLKSQKVIFTITMVLMTIYLGWRIFFTLPLEEGIWNVLAGLLLIIAEGLTVFSTFELFFQKMQKKRTHLDMPTIPDEYFPHIDVFIATHNEPVELLYKTVNACTFMEYPDKSKVHIYISDDGCRPEVAELAAQLNVGYIDCPNNKHAKSGNLNNALSKSNSPLIATFDADMIPQHTFLMKTVPYFLLKDFIEDNGTWRLRTEEDPKFKYKLGLIQTPQSFYNPDLFQFNLFAENGIPNEQDFFSREVNILRNTSNAVAYTGSNTVLLRQALEDIGGFPYNTITEDFEVSIRFQQEGYLTYATDEVQAAGLTTTTVKSMIKQRIRWARGIIQSLQNTKAIVSKKLPFWTRVTYLTSFLYWWSFFNRLVFIMSPILFALFDFKIVDTTFMELLIFWLPAYFFYSIAMRFLSSNIRNQRWSQIIDTIFMPYLIIPVLLETLFIREKKFKVTSKKKTTERAWLTTALYSLPHLVLFVLSVVALVHFVKGKYGVSIIYSSIIIFWLTYNLISLCYAIFFLIGRRAYRDSERIQAKERVTVTAKDGALSYVATTVDVSDKGLAFYVDSPIYIPLNSEIKLIVESQKYKTYLKGTIVYVKQDGEGWRYSALVEPINEQDKRHYMQLIYDRNHSLPKQLDLWDTAYEDLVRNVKRRLSRPIQHRRQSPRIMLSYPIQFTNKKQCQLTSFNYVYFSANSFIGEFSIGERLIFQTPSGIEVIVHYTGKHTANQQDILLQVENMEELVELDLVETVIAEMTGKAKEKEVEVNRSEQYAEHI